jgi:hypothetical protein
MKGTNMGEPEAPTRRGRPRPQTTIERDTKVLDLVSAAGEAGLSRPAIAEQLGEGSKPSEAYLSLYRLRKDGKVERKTVDSKQVWVAVAA